MRLDQSTKIQAKMDGLSSTFTPEYYENPLTMLLAMIHSRKLKRVGKLDDNNVRVYEARCNVTLSNAGDPYQFTIAKGNPVHFDLTLNRFIKP